MALALVDEVRVATQAVSWNGIAAITNLAVLQVLLEIAKQCCRVEFSASVRQIGERARVNASTVWKSLRRLVRAGWLIPITRARGARAATWSLRSPTKGADRAATILHARKAGDHVWPVDPCFTQGDRAGLSRSVPSFDHDLFRWRKGLGFAKGRIYSLLAVSRTASQIAKALGYKHPRNARLHLRVLMREGLLRRLDDGRYARGDANLDVLAARRGVLGAADKQRARHLVERRNWRRWSEAFERWRQTGEVVDPETGEVLEPRPTSHKGVTIRTFRQLVLSILARRIGVSEGKEVQQP
ncbi:MAG: hypothetical protein ABSD31_13660 [Candidatus Binataceae bacterium]|jgi:DNA-binding MarR family transcriptional regulator